MTTRLLKSSENINGLPIGFQEVEYLETTNQQNNDTSTNNAAYIDTGVLPDATTKVECRVQFTTLISGNSNEALFGTTGVNSSDPARFAFGFASLSPYTNFYMGLGTQNLTTSVARDTNTHTFTIDASTSSWKIDDTTGTFSNPGAVVGAGSIYLFARNYAAYEYANKPANAKTYYCKIWKGGSLVRDLIPALNPAGRPCMYDLVEKKAYYNIGTGEFTYGRKIIPVEYLESTGTQYIDTGIVAKSGIKSILNFEYTSITDTASMLDARSGNNRLYLCHVGKPSDIFYFYFGYGSATQSSTVPTVNTRYLVETDLSVGSQSMKVNGTSIATGSSSTSYNLGVNLYLFGMNYSTPQYLAFAKLYCCKITEGSTLVRDFIPCIDENNVPYMFDKVTHTCYLNAGTGTFNYGKKLYSSKVRLYKDSEASKLPAGFKRVEYLESNGGQYIDTGIQPTDEYGYRIRNTYTTGQGEQCAIGCMDSGNRFVGIYTSGSANAISGAWGSFVGFLPAYTWETGTILDVKCNYKNSRKIVIGETEMKDISSIQISGTISNTLYIGARHYGSTITTMKGKIYGVEITKGTEVINKFIPALDTTNTPCMYDTVTQTAFYNQGSGQFTYGAVIPNKVRLSQSTEIRFPKGYTEVEYLEGTGTQYIDTGVNADSNLGFDVSYKWDTFNTVNSRFLGVIKQDGSNYLRHHSSDSGSSFTYFVSNDSTTIQGTGTTGFHSFSYNSVTKKFNFDGTAISAASPITFDVGLDFWLFGRNSNVESLKSYASVKIYQAKLYNGSTLIRYFIPCLDPNGRPCLWDTVTKKPYYNQGTGEFTYGRSIQQVEYLESTGTQYIDTGMKLTNNHSVELDYQLTQATQSRTGLFGALNMTGSNQGRFGSILSPSNQQLEHGYGAGNDYWQQGLPNTNRHKIYQKKNEVYFDGTLIHTFDTATFNLTINAYLGNFVYTNYTPAKAKYYRSKWWDGETLVRDYVPAIDSNNTGFMFDRATHTIFDNAGTGSFAYGNTVPNIIRN